MVSPPFFIEVVMHIQVLEEIDHEAILSEANSIKVYLKKGWRDVTQIGIQGHKPNLNPEKEWKNSIGRVTKLQYPETYFKYPLFDTPIINRLMEKYSMIRTRIMLSDPKTCLTRHEDLSKRIHIPLVTNPDCLMIIEDSAYFLEPGKVYLTNTTLRHTAVNASLFGRIHIVGCVYQN